MNVTKPRGDGAAGRDRAASERFWRVFEQTRNPMSLLDEDRRYVAVNDAMVALYGYPRDRLIGMLADTMLAESERIGIDARWSTLLQGGELFGERTVLHADGSVMRVQYAGHATRATGQWLALVVALSARPVLSGDELVASGPIAHGGLIAPAESELTRREQEVVERLALGMTGPEIARTLHISPETVRTHVRNAMAKTNTHTRAQLVARAVAEGLITSR